MDKLLSCKSVNHIPKRISTQKKKEQIYVYNNIVAISILIYLYIYDLSNVCIFHTPFDELEFVIFTTFCLECR